MNGREAGAAASSPRIAICGIRRAGSPLHAAVFGTGAHGSNAPYPALCDNVSLQFLRQIRWDVGGTITASFPS